MKADVKDILFIFWKEARKYPWLVLFAWIFVIGASAINIIIPIYYKRFFDVLTAANLTRDGDGLLQILIIILSLNIIAWIGWRITTFTQISLQIHVMEDLKQKAFGNLMKRSFSFFSNSFAGSLVQKVNRLARSFERFTDRITWDIFPLLVRVIGITAVLWFFNFWIAVVMFVWTILFLAVNYYFSKWKMKYDIVSAAKDSETTAVLADAITNHSNVQLFSGIFDERERFKKATNEYSKITKFTWNLEGVAEAVQALLFIGAEFLLLYFALQFWQEGKLSIGTFVLIQAYIIQLINQLWNFGRTVRDVYRSMADAEEMATILKTPYEIKDRPNAKKLYVSEGKVVFSNVSFGYDKNFNVIDNMNLSIEPGEKMALIGPSGAGKSTIIKLLFRFYEIQKGKIMIDGQDIGKVTQESLRDNLSLVPQDPILFHRTLMQNIRYGKRDASEEEVIKAAKLAHCDEFIKNFPKGYDTYVGERGVKLSGGERQRVAIARAILKNAPILVLDEATSSLDSESEALIQDALKVLMRNKTVIVIAHRLSTIKQMNRIVVVKNGLIAEEGTHEQLINNENGIYRELWRLQAGGFLPE